MKELSDKNATYMLKRTFIITLTSACCITASAMPGNDETTRSWALIGGMSTSCPTANSHGIQPPAHDKAASFGEATGNVMLEYYLPRQHFSLVGGYNTETLEWYGGDISATMHNISVGSRYYPLSASCAIQPYASLAAYANVGTSDERSRMEFYSSNGSHERSYSIEYPRMSIVPAIGFDCYILSSVALEVQYGFPLAIDGKTRVISTYGKREESYPMHSDMHRHNIQIGLKATFPFRLTTKDGNNIFDLIYMALGIYDPNDEPRKQTRTERRKQSLNKVLNSY